MNGPGPRTMPGLRQLPSLFCLMGNPPLLMVNQYTKNATPIGVTLCQIVVVTSLWWVPSHPPHLTTLLFNLPSLLPFPQSHLTQSGGTPITPGKTLQFNKIRRQVVAHFLQKPSLITT